MNTGIIGSGLMGSALDTSWAHAGHGARDHRSLRLLAPIWY